ncbi:MAG TPA: tetratricopeptide repeat protein, partial [Candidatus Obscuribacter sp.]|nr:tetratricopeptide repeat protein [Candidatus Obscuribacter sp.]
QAAKEAMQEKNAREEQEKERKEAAERIKLFQEVLEIDPDDLFANQGLGNCYNILGEHERAIGYLEKAIAIKENHTQCYEDLGKAYEALGNLARAAEYYGKGVEIAAKKGDMQPLKAMKAKLEALLLQSGK